MKKVIRLTENDLARIVKKVIRENQDQSDMFGKKLKEVFVDVLPEGGVGPKTYVILNSGEKITMDNNLSVDEWCAKGGSGPSLNKNCSAAFELNNFQYSCTKIGCVKD